MTLALTILAITAGIVTLLWQKADWYLRLREADLDEIDRALYEDDLHISWADSDRVAAIKMVRQDALDGWAARATSDKVTWIGNHPAGRGKSSE